MYAIRSYYEFHHEKDEAVLSGWAKHFRNHYCLDTEIDFLEVQVLSPEVVRGILVGARERHLEPVDSGVVEVRGQSHALEPVDPDYRGEVAERWRYADVV